MTGPGSTRDGEAAASRASDMADELRRLRRKRGAEATKAHILESAASVFAKKGYYGSTVDDIARAAGYSPAAIYKYFVNKEDLFQQLWNVMAGRLQDLFDEGVRTPLPFRPRLAWLVSRISLLLEHSPDLVVAFIAQRPYAALSSHSNIERHAYQHYLAHRQQIVALVQIGIDEGVLRDEDPEDYASLLIGLLYEFAYKWVTAPAGFDITGNVNKVVHLFMAGAGVHDSSSPTA